MAEKAADGTPVVALPVVTERTVIREIKPDPPLGPNATSEGITDPSAHYFEVDGRKVNAWGETKGSDEDKKRWV